MGHRSRFFVWTVPAACVALVGAVAVSHRARQASGSSRAGGAPLPVRPACRVLLDTGPGQQALWSSWVRPPAEGTAPVSGLLHVLRVHGLGGRFDHPLLKDGRDVLRLLTDESFSRSYFGAPAVARTRDGIEFIGQGTSRRDHELTAEAHRDQCLASLAELGLPLSTPVRAGGEDLTLADALADSTANFHLKQKELQWTAIAYALYLPPRDGWVNKFGERFRFDDLVDELLADPIEESSCAGTHQGYALTLLYRADREHAPILSRGPRDRLRRHLERVVAEVLATQAEDGSWASDWGRAFYSGSRPVPSADGMSVEDRLLVTGHLAEWLLYLPPEFAVPDDRLRRAGLWLRSQVEGVREGAFDGKLICPYTHAVCVIRALSPPGRTGGEGGS